MRAMHWAAVPIGRRRFLAESSIALVGASTGLGAFGRTAPGESQFIEVETSGGRVRGAQADGLVTFKGIPYAGSVSGRNRFKAATTAETLDRRARSLAAWRSVDAAEPESAATNRRLPRTASS